MKECAKEFKEKEIENSSLSPAEKENYIASINVMLKFQDFLIENLRNFKVKMK